MLITSNHDTTPSCFLFCTNAAPQPVSPTNSQCLQITSSAKPKIHVWNLTTVPTLPSSQPSAPINMPNSPSALIFMALPNEIRAMILTYLLALGDLSIMRVSHELREECQRYLFKYAYFRINAGIDEDFMRPEIDHRYLSLCPQTLGRVQNIEISIDHWSLSQRDYLTKSHIINFGSRGWPADFDICSIRITNIPTHVASYVKSEALSSQFFGLSKFKTVRFTAVTSGRLYAKQSSYAKYVSLCTSLPIIIRARNKDLYDKARKAFMPELGRAVWYEARTQEDRYLEFEVPGKKRSGPAPHPMNRTRIPDRDIWYWSKSKGEIHCSNFLYRALGDSGHGDEYWLQTINLQSLFVPWWSSEGAFSDPQFGIPWNQGLIPISSHQTGSSTKQNSNAWCRLAAPLSPLLSSLYSSAYWTLLDATRYHPPRRLSHQKHSVHKPTAHSNKPQVTHSLQFCELSG